jgi:hypothetical protein
VLVHRLQSRAGEDVLCELAACAQGAGQEAWDANFSKVGGEGAALLCVSRGTGVRACRWGGCHDLRGTAILQVCTGKAGRGAFSSTISPPTRRAPRPAQVLLAALAATKHASDRIREAAFALVRELAAHQAGHFGPVLDVVVQPLLLGCADASREVGARRGPARAACHAHPLPNGSALGCATRMHVSMHPCAPLAPLNPRARPHVHQTHASTRTQSAHTSTHAHILHARNMHTARQNTQHGAQVMVAATQALEALVDAMPPARCLEVLRLKLPTPEALNRRGPQAAVGPGQGLNHACVRACKRTHTHTHTRARTHARTHTRTRTRINTHATHVLPTPAARPSTATCCAPPSAASSAPRAACRRAS